MRLLAEFHIVGAQWAAEHRPLTPVQLNWFFCPKALPAKQKSSLR
jgi:hypothetical protein